METMEDREEKKAEWNETRYILRSWTQQNDRP